MSDRQRLYLFIGVCTVGGIIGGACTAGPSPSPSPSGSPSPSPTPGTSEKAFVGAATCQQCHSGTHSDWSETAHATAFETLRTISQHENTECILCHTVGYGEDDGFVDEATTPELVGVQCENCHGPAGDHARRATNGDFSDPPPVNVGASVCGACHTGFHHPTFDEWMQSRHSMALTTLRESGHGQDTCLQCHSQDYRYAVEQGDTPPTLDTAEVSIECSTCHSPHGGTGETAQLRAPVADVCGECHTQGEEALPGNAPHHPQLEMLTGSGARTEDGGELAQAGVHSSLVGGEACARCHVVMIAIEEPMEGSPNATGHTFNPFDDEITEFQPSEKFAGCDPCHTPAAAQANIDSEQPMIAARLSALSVFFDTENGAYISTDGLSDADKARLAVAKFNFDFVGADGSLGVHNPQNADAALDVAEAITDDLSSP